MIYPAVRFITELLNQFMLNRFQLNDEIVCMSNLSSSEGVGAANIENKVVLTIINIEEETLKLHFCKYFEREIVENSKNRFKELIPDEFNNTVLLLSYLNEMNKKFYTKYTKFGEVEKNSSYKRKPKIKKRI